MKLLLAIIGAFCIAQSALADAESITGSLPHSNQWIFDQYESFLYLGYNSSGLAQPSLRMGNYLSSFDSAKLNYGSVEHFLKVFSFASPESSSFFRNLSFWVRYGLGVGVRQGHLSNEAYSLSYSSESTHLLVAMAKLGFVLNYDLASWIQPYAGVVLSPFVFRHSASLTGAESQGGGARLAPLVGLHLPILFEHKLTLYSEVSFNSRVAGRKEILGDSTDLNLGIGFVF